MTWTISGRGPTHAVAREHFNAALQAEPRCPNKLNVGIAVHALCEFIPYDRAQAITATGHTSDGSSFVSVMVCTTVIGVDETDPAPSLIETAEVAP